MTGLDLKAARETLGLTQDQMAARLGFLQGHITRMENGKTPVTRTTEIAVLAMIKFGLPETWPA